MTEEKKEILKKSKIGLIREEINLQFHWYLLGFFTTYFGSFFIPVIIFMAYILLVFVPFFLDNPSFIMLFTDLSTILAWTSFPLIFIGCYTLHLYFVALITRMWWQYTERKSPTKNGNIPRNIPSRALNFYHIRSFLIKYPKYAFTKGVFPWLVNWLYNFVGTNKIGKGTTIEEQVCADKLIRVGDNCYIGVNSVLTSHLVEGIFGRVTYFELIVGDNVTLAGGNNFASGCHINDDAYLLPFASGGKHYTIKGNNYYFGGPLRKIFKKKVAEYLKLTPEQLNKNAEIMKRHKREKDEKNNPEVKTND